MNNFKTIITYNNNSKVKVTSLRHLPLKMPPLLVVNLFCIQSKTCFLKLHR